MLERYVISAGRRLRCGYTTGACAAAAAKAAAQMLLNGKPVLAVSLDTPKGVRLDLDVEDARIENGCAVCAVRKDAGDDIDVTDGILVYAQVRLMEHDEVTVDGGRGVGRVTRAGLEQPVGAAAINRVPRLMIADAVREVLIEHGCRTGAAVVVFAPEGEKIAARTYNPRLGIEGGISILGTTGIVEPMSETALVDTIRVELEMLRAAGDAPVLVTPGNYGEVFARETLNMDLSRSVLCSNFLGETFDHAVRLGFRGVLLIGHIGKLVKLAGGIFQTHSRVADARMEILAAHAALAGADRETAQALMDCITTDEAVERLEQKALLPIVMQSVTDKIAYHIKHRAGAMPVEAIIYSNGKGVLGNTSGAWAMAEQFKKIGETT